MPAGYSDRSLVDKLGLKPGAHALILDAPQDYASTLGALPESARIEWCASTDGLPDHELDFIQVFLRSQDELAALVPRLKSVLEDAGMLWISWPKKSSKVPTDVTEDRVREVALASGLVDVKVCAVDEVWSGLKLVRRLADRKASSKPASRRGAQPRAKRSGH